MSTRKPLRVSNLRGNGTIRRSASDPTKFWKCWTIRAVAGSSYKIVRSRSPCTRSRSHGRVSRGDPQGQARGIVTARVLFDGTHGISVNTRTRIRDTRDWHLQGCQVEVGGDVYINTVCTFGAASASYNWWSRVAAAIGRITQCFCGRCNDVAPVCRR